ncbi:MAG: bifunctional folylpolyglutamate synthase/dihydrofolate synthase [Lachnospiraceae bacterium]|nr:bifunctional folylpolyglutamate synthase/dihydrofolate synthase [Lachnospiraceae bacterium]
MTYNECLHYLRHLPAFTPAGVLSGKITYDLNAITALCSRLGDPQKELKFVHITGTNGKGSTLAFLRSILTTAGLKTGSFTSPELVDYEEQVQIDGEMIPQEAVARHLSAVITAAEEMRQEGRFFPSPFEMTLAMAFLYFLEEGCDIVLLEVGMGGKTDATNVIGSPLLALFVRISLDHTQILGDTLTAIAREKAGIIKAGTKVLSLPQPKEAEQVLQETCQKLHVPLEIIEPPAKLLSRSVEGQSFYLPLTDEAVRIPLLGTYQPENASLAAEAASCVLEQLGYHTLCNINDMISEGLAHTTWPCRFELISKDPYVLVDGGHNVQGARVLSESLRAYFPEKKITFIFGVLKDKDYREIIKIMGPLAKEFITVAPDSPRAMDAVELADYLREKGYSARPAASYEEAVSLGLAACDDVLLAFGSLYFVGKLRQIFSLQYHVKEL